MAISARVKKGVPHKESGIQQCRNAGLVFDHQCQADQCAQGDADDFPRAVLLKAHGHGENRQNCHRQTDEDAKNGGGVATGEEHCHQTGHDVCRPEQQQRKPFPVLLPALQKEDSNPCDRCQKQHSAGSDAHPKPQIAHLAADVVRGDQNSRIAAQKQHSRKDGTMKCHGGSFFRCEYYSQNDCQCIQQEAKHRRGDVRQGRRHKCVKRQQHRHANGGEPIEEGSVLCDVLKFAVKHVG